ncbi:hypothetical protein ZWY2020_030744 [Hordeum vulgare]|nr:hypothetical protein ZWY2020_030744 [Hordeum vulgare]
MSPPHPPPTHPVAPARRRCCSGRVGSSRSARGAAVRWPPLPPVSPSSGPPTRPFAVSRDPLFVNTAVSLLHSSLTSASGGYFAYDQLDMLRYRLYSGWIRGILMHTLFCSFALHWLCIGM